METKFALGCISIVLAFVSASACVYAGIAQRNYVKAAIAASAYQRAKRSWLLWRVRNGYSFLKLPARVLLKREHIHKLVSEAVLLLGERGCLTTAEALLSLTIAALAVLFCAVSVVSCSFVCGVAVVCCVVGGVCAAIKTEQEKRWNTVREAVPDALRAMSVCFRAGFSLLQTFQQASQDMQGPMQRLFARSAHLLETGYTTSEALSVFRKESSVHELAFVAVALDVQHQTGGSMTRVLDSACDAVKSELDLERSLRVQTAQAKLSARIVSIMPFLLIAVFTLVSKDFLAPFFKSPLGVALLIVALVMQIAGVLLVRQLLKVDR